MLRGSRFSFASKAIFTWAITAVVLQLFVEIFDIQYDSDQSLLWWISALLSLPSHLVIETLTGFGFDLRNVAGYIVVTVVIALVADWGIGKINSNRSPP